MNQNIWKLAIEGMRGERKNTVLRILILFLSFLFIVVTLSVTASLNKTGEEYRYRQYGEWTSAVTDGAEQERAVFLEDPQIQTVGTAQICGTVLGADGDSLTSIGALDDSLLGMAHLSMQSGRMPESADEVAMEADILSALGYPYELGQQIALAIQRGSQTVEKTYTLCGIITEYTDVWCHGDALWAGAVLTQEEADTYGRADSYQYFLFTELTNVELVKSYGKTYSFLANTAVTGTQEVEQIYYGALALIFAVTAVAVFALYFVQMKAKVRSLALFRSIGATNRQLAQRLFCETVLAMLPALFLGTAAGAFITWLILSLFLSIGVEQVCVAVPFVQLAAAAALWEITVFLAQLVILWNAVHQPLVGRMSAQRKALVRQNRIRFALLVLMAAAFISVGSLSYEKARAYQNADERDSDICDYDIRKSGDAFLSNDILHEIEDTPGVTEVRAGSTLIAAMDFLGMDDSRLVQALQEKAELMPDIGTGGENAGERLRVYVEGLREEDVETFLDEIGSTADYEAFLSGEEVILWFGNGEDTLCASASDTGLAVGDTVTLNLYQNGEMTEDGVQLFEEPGIFTRTSVRVGEMVIQDGQTLLGRKFYGNRYYTVIASEALIRKMYGTAISGNVILSSGRCAYRNQEYEWANVWTGDGASFLSTDYAVAHIASLAGVELSNQREEHDAHRRQMRQMRTYLYLGGACIDGMLLLLMWNLLAGAGAQNRRKYGILQALGMSERQKRQRIQRSGVVFVLAGVAVSTLADGVALQGAGSAGMWGISIGLAIVLYLFYVVSQNHDLRGPLMESIRSE